MKISNKTIISKLPIVIDKRIGKLADVASIPKTKAFILQEKFLFGDFKVKKVLKKKDKKEYLLAFEI